MVSLFMVESDDSFQSFPSTVLGHEIMHLHRPSAPELCLCLIKIAGECLVAGGLVVGDGSASLLMMMFQTWGQYPVPLVTVQ